MRVLRLIVASEITYVLNVLSEAVGETFDDRRVIDIPLRTANQEAAAVNLQYKFRSENFSAVLRNGPNAIVVYAATVVEI